MPIKHWCDKGVKKVIPSLVTKEVSVTKLVNVTSAGNPAGEFVNNIRHKWSYQSKLATGSAFHDTLTTRDLKPTSRSKLPSATIIVNLRNYDKFAIWPSLRKGDLSFEE